MDEFFKKYPYSPDEGDGIKMIDKKTHDAKHYYKDGKMFEALKCLKEAQSMLDDFITVVES